jgi:hypothetical protein
VEFPREAAAALVSELRDYRENRAENLILILPVDKGSLNANAALPHGGGLVLEAQALSGAPDPACGLGAILELLDRDLAGQAIPDFHQPLHGHGGGERRDGVRIRVARGKTDQRTSPHSEP